VRIVILSNEPARLAGIRMHPDDRQGWDEQANKKAPPKKRQCLTDPRVMVHARLTATAYVEERAHVHGLDGAYLQHQLSQDLLEPQGLQVNPKHVSA
jgi:hypothetical protein